eukprot:6181663-Pleurochrysis_carterae.AAC.2
MQGASIENRPPHARVCTLFGAAGALEQAVTVTEGVIVTGYLSCRSPARYTSSLDRNGRAEYCSAEVVSLIIDVCAYRWDSRRVGSARSEISRG